MSVTLVSETPCWALPYGPEDLVIHFPSFEAAIQSEAKRLRDWPDSEPLTPTPETQHCWTASCDGDGCGYEVDDDECGPGAHIAGTKDSVDRAYLAGDLFEQPDGSWLCLPCHAEAMATVELPASHPKAQIPGQGELLADAS